MIIVMLLMNQMVRNDVSEGQMQVFEKKRKWFEFGIITFNCAIFSLSAGPEKACLSPIHVPVTKVIDVNVCLHVTFFVCVTSVSVIATIIKCIHKNNGKKMGSSTILSVIHTVTNGIMLNTYPLDPPMCVGGGRQET